MKVLFVCLGNICRSPTAEGIFKKICEDESAPYSIDSAGTSAWHEGESPDSRSQAHASQRGYDLKGASRQVQEKDFEEFDWILAMDSKNYNDLLSMAPKEHEHKVRLITDYCQIHSKEKYSAGIPDPYSSGPDGFDLVLDLLEDSCKHLYQVIKAKEEKRSFS